MDKKTLRVDIVNPKNYPLLSESKLAHMRNLVKRDDSIYCFPYYRTKKGVPYVDVYVWNKSSLREWTRYVIAEGFCLCCEDANEFWASMASTDLIVDSMCIDKVVDCICKNHPSVNIKKYSEYGHILLHIYAVFSSDKLHEILFKEQLNWLAVYFDTFKDCNLEGTTPREILGVSIGMLRSMNREDVIDNFREHREREELNNIYKAFCNRIDYRKINRFRLWYLRTVYYSGEDVEESLFKIHGKMKADEDYIIFMRYQKFKRLIDEYHAKMPKDPSLKEMRSLGDFGELFSDYVKPGNDYNELYSRHYHVAKEMYQYENEQYIVFPPEDVRDLITEAVIVTNCLHKLVWEVACGNTVLLFMREKANPDKPLITLEVKDGKFDLALWSYGDEIYGDRRAFLKEYAQAKNLEYATEYPDDYSLWLFGGDWLKRCVDNNNNDKNVKEEE